MKEYIKDKYSKRHHYLPVFYLKGFGDDNELLFVYDKIENKILTKQNPESKFYENHLNNYKFKGDVKFTLEEPLFSPQDAKGAELFKKIRSTNYITEDFLTPLERFETLGFISRLYWRSPSSNKLFVELIKKEGLSNKYFGVYIKETQKQLSDDEIPHIKEQMLNDEELQKVFKHIIPLSTASNKEIYRLYDKWKIYTHKVQTPCLITGDSPFLINNNDVRMDNVFNELIFPISKDRLLILSEKAPKFLDAVLLTNVNLCILHQSKRYIVCENEEYLKTLLHYYNVYSKKNNMANIVNDTFGLAYYQSKFKNHAEYYEEFQKGQREYGAKNNN